MGQCGNHWIGLRFRYPMIWLPTRVYKKKYALTKKEEFDCWNVIMETGGYLHPNEPGNSDYYIINLHEFPPSFTDSD